MAIRTEIFLLGFILAAVWIVGLVDPQAAAWLDWIDGGLAAAAMIFSVERVGDSRLVSMPITLSILLFAVSFLGWVRDVVTWLYAANFALACAFLAIGLQWAVRANRAGKDRSDRAATSARTDRMNDRIRKAG